MNLRRNVLAAGLAAAGLAGGVAATQVLVRRSRDRGPSPEDATAPPVDARAERTSTAVTTDAVTTDAVTTDADLPADVEVHLLTLGDGTELRVLARGRGRPLVLLHGITLSADIWFGQLRDLPDAGFRVVAPDLRGHGRSTVGSDGLALRRLGDDLAAVLDRLDLDDAVVVGHSMGGMVGLELLTRDAPDVGLADSGSLPTGGADGLPAPAAADVDPGPAGTAGRRLGGILVDVGGGRTRRVSALALVASSASPVLGRGVPGLRAAVALGAPVLNVTARATRLLPGPSLPDSYAGDPIARVSFGPGAPSRSVRLIRRVTARVPARVTAELLVQLVSFDAESRLGRLVVPTTVVVGTSDLMTPVRHARTLAAAIPDTELVILPDCGHMVMLERPDELAGALRRLARRVAG